MHFNGKSSAAPRSTLYEGSGGGAQVKDPCCRVEGGTNNNKNRKFPDGFSLSTQSKSAAITCGNTCAYFVFQNKKIYLFVYNFQVFSFVASSKT